MIFTGVLRMAREKQIAVRILRALLRSFCLSFVVGFLSIGVLNSPTFASPQASPASTDENRFPEDDRKAYELMLSAYQKQNIQLLSSLHSKFVKTFPQSPLRDNATFLVAQLYMEKGMWKQAAGPINKILKSNAVSERWPSAIYSKGLIYKNIGMQSKAQQQWQILLKRFPGSKESQKAWIALRLMDSDNKVN